MNIPHFPISLTLVLVCLISAGGQKRRTHPSAKSNAVQKVREVGNSAVVIDETLSVLRTRPSLLPQPIQRMRRGRKVQIIGATEADGVRFYKVSAPPGYFGWVQSDAVFGKFRASDENRFARLVQAADGFDQLELASKFLEMYPQSQFRPPILLLLGDLLEDAAAKLSRDASSRLSRSEMAASGAPMHSYYLNFNMIDRYRRLGVTFLFNTSTRSYHYGGESWREIARKYPTSAEAVEARKRIDSLLLKMERQTAVQ